MNITQKLLISNSDQTYYNPNGLNIGDQIRVNKISSVEYDVDGNRKIFKHEKNKQLIVCGTVKKALGKYSRGSGYSTLEGYEEIPPSLTVSSYVWFYLCRLCISDKPVLIHPEDIIEKI